MSPTPLSETARLALDASQANYLGNVLRLDTGAPVLVFNGRDGEWRATVDSAGKRRLLLVARRAVRAQTAALDLHYLFAPLKHARLDYMVQKAVEMGASRLQPVLTRTHRSAAINLERMRANAIEAAEQCGILTLPEIAAPLMLEPDVAPNATAAACWCSATKRPRSRTRSRRWPRTRRAAGPTPVAVLVGPEGGFAEDERAALLLAAEQRAARARPAHPARRHRRGRRTGAGRCRARRLAVTAA